MLKARAIPIVAATAAAAFTIGQADAVRAADMVDGPSVVWNMSTWGKPRAWSVLFEELAKHLDERTGGKFKFNIHWGTLSQPNANLDGISIGAFQAASYSANYYPGKLEAVTGLDLPFLPIDTLPQLAAVSDEYMEIPAVKGEFTKWGAMYYASSTIPLYEVLGKGNPPKSLDDWKGMKLRALGLMGQGFRELGAVPVGTAAPEVYQALDRGLVDAAAFGYYAHVAYKVYEAAQWYTKGLQVTTGAASGTIFSLKAYEALPPQYKKLLDDFPKERGYALQIAAYNVEEEAAPGIFQKAGLTEVPISTEMRRQIADKAAPPVWSTWIEKMNGLGHDGQALVDALVASAEKHKNASY